MSIPSNRKTWVVVADGRKALILENAGTDPKPRLEVISRREIDNPPTREQGTDRPGRMSDASAHGRSAMQETDWHEFEEAEFARELAARLGRAAERGRFERLIVAAAPATLGVLRKALSGRAAGAVDTEIDKDLTNHSIEEIERHLQRAFGF